MFFVLLCSYISYLALVCPCLGNVRVESHTYMRFSNNKEIASGGNYCCTINGTEIMHKRCLIFNSGGRVYSLSFPKTHNSIPVGITLFHEQFICYHESVIFQHENFDKACLILQTHAVMSTIITTTTTTTFRVSNPSRWRTTLHQGE